MAVNVGAIEGRLTLDGRQYKKTMDQAEKETKDLGKTAERTSRRVRGAFTRMSAGADGLRTRVVATSRGMRGLAAIAGVALGGGFVKQALAATDAIGKFADRLGVGVETLQELEFAASQSGIATNQFRTGLQRMTRRAAEAAQGTGEAKDAFRQLGIQLTDNQGNLRSTEDLLGDIADAFSGVESQAERVRLAFKLFDTEGVTFVNLLRLGKSGLEDLRKAARDAGIVLDESLVRKAEAANDAIDVLSRAMSSTFTEAAIKISDVLKSNQAELQATIKLIGQIGSVATRVLTGIASEFKSMVDDISTEGSRLRGILRGIPIIGGMLAPSEAGRGSDNPLGLAPGQARPGDTAPIGRDRIGGIRRRVVVRISAEEAAKRQAEKMKKITESLSNEQAQAMERAGQRVEGLIARYRKLGETQEDFIQKGRETFTGGFIETGLQSITASVQQLAIGFARGTQTATSFSDAIKDLSASLLSSLGGALLNLGISGLSGGILSKLGGGTFGAGAGKGMGLPGFASGGIVTKPTLAMVGEKGPEVVLNKSQIGDMMKGGGQPITIVNAPSAEAGDQAATDAEARGHRVIRNSILSELRQGEGSPLVKQLRAMRI